MSSLAVLLPMSQDSIDGFAMIKNYRATAKQNFKMLLLTNPGERVMLPQFGVGLKKYLFTNMQSNTSEKIRDNIRNQVSRYMPYIEIIDIQFSTSASQPNYYAMRVHYSLPSADSEDILDIIV